MGTGAWVEENHPRDERGRFGETVEHGSSLLNTLDMFRPRGVNR
jgi:hypothetical protein